MSITRNGSKMSRHGRFTNSQIFDLKKDKIFPSSSKHSDSPTGIFMSSSKAPDYGQGHLLNNDALKNKIKEKRIQKSMNTELLLNKLVTRVESKIAQFPFKKKMLAINPTIEIPSQLKPYSLTPQSRISSFQFQSPTSKPRSQSQNKRIEIYYLSKLQKAFDSNETDYFSRIYREHFHQTYQGLNHRFFPQNNSDYNRLNKLTKKCQQFITLFFDLDETLVHCNENPSMPCDIILDINISKNQIVKAGLNIRPYAKELLKNLSKSFEIIIFTASHSCYAEKVCNFLDPDSSIISHRLFRDSCTLTNNSLYTKDLKIFCDNTNRPLSQVALIDNASYSYAWQLENGIPIIPFYDNKEDKELMDLEKYLKNMIGTIDVREYNKSHLKLNLFIDQRGPYKVLENLFGKSLQSIDEKSLCYIDIKITDFENIVKERLNLSIICKFFKFSTLEWLKKKQSRDLVVRRITERFEQSKGRKAQLESTQAQNADQKATIGIIRKISIKNSTKLPKAKRFILIDKLRRPRGVFL